MGAARTRLFGRVVQLGGGYRACQVGVRACFGASSLVASRLKVQVCGAMIALLAIAACDRGQPSKRGVVELGHDRLGDEIVATVYGHGIHKREVQERMRAERIDARAALTGLENDLLLALRAESSGNADEEVSRSESRALAQALLVTAVERAPEGVVSPGEIDRLIAADPSRFTRKETRESAHLRVVRTAGMDNAAQKRAVAVLEGLLLELRGQPNATELLPTLAEQVRSAGFEVALEAFPPFAREGVNADYATAVFDRAETGLIPTVVATSFGFHLIAVTAIHPAAQEASEEARAEVLSQLQLERRTKLAADLIAQLTARARLYVDDAVVRSMLARDSLGEPEQGNATQAALR